MLSKLTYYILNCLFKFSGLMNLIPYTFDMKTRAVTIIPEKTYFGIFKSRPLGYRIMSLVVIGNLVFGGIRLLQSIYFLDKSFQDCMFNLFVFLVSCLSNLVQLNNLCKPEEVAKLGTIFFQQEKYLTSKYNIS